MPIKKENIHRYPANWKHVRENQLSIARHACEICGIKNYSVARWIGKEWRDIIEFGTYAEARKAATESTAVHWEPGQERFVVIVLTIAHLDHRPENCDPSNLRALCQRHHLAHDLKMHIANAYETRRKGKAHRDLFDER